MKQTQRLDKVISNCGLGTRKEVKELVRKGLVSVNGQIIKTADMQVDPETDNIFFKGEQIKYKKFIYLMMNKPAGVITATQDKHERTVFDILPDRYKQFDLSPAGRLDKDTEGLLILTNDGESIHELLSPKKHVDKKYYAVLEKCVNPNYFTAVKNGINIGGYVTLPAELEEISEREIFLTIHEGKFHQVKRMFEALGNKVVYLKRVKMGELELDPELMKGETRELTEEETRVLLKK